MKKLNLLFGFLFVAMSAISGQNNLVYIAPTVGHVSDAAQEEGYGIRRVGNDIQVFSTDGKSSIYSQNVLVYVDQDDWVQICEYGEDADTTKRRELLVSDCNCEGMERFAPTEYEISFLEHLSLSSPKGRFTLMIGERLWDVKFPQGGKKGFIKPSGAKCCSRYFAIKDLDSKE